ERLILLAESSGFVARDDGDSCRWQEDVAGGAERGAANKAMLPEMRKALGVAYDRFLYLNVKCKNLISTVQLRMQSGGVVRWKDLVELRRISGEICAALGDLTQWGTRFGAYASRLRRAEERVERGEIKYLWDVFVDSFHTV